MPREISLKKAIFSTFLALLPCQTLLAESYGTSNNPPSPPQQVAPQQGPQQPPAPQCNANNTVTDPRVPPAGTYKVDHGDGSSEEVYTTGEKKPYYVDNNCNQNANAQVPQIFVQPTLQGNIPVPNPVR